MASDRQREGASWASSGASCSGGKTNTDADNETNAAHGEAYRSSPPYRGVGCDFQGPITPQRGSITPQYGSNAPAATPSKVPDIKRHILGKALDVMFFSPRQPPFSAFFTRLFSRCGYISSRYFRLRGEGGGGSPSDTTESGFQKRYRAYRPLLIHNCSVYAPHSV